MPGLGGAGRRGGGGGATALRGRGSATAAANRRGAASIPSTGGFGRCRRGGSRNPRHRGAPARASTGTSSGEEGGGLPVRREEGGGRRSAGLEGGGAHGVAGGGVGQPAGVNTE